MADEKTNSTQWTILWKNRHYTLALSASQAGDLYRSGANKMSRYVVYLILRHYPLKKQNKGVFP